MTTSITNLIKGIPGLHDTINSNFQTIANAVDNNLDKIGDLTSNGLTETDLATAIKKNSQDISDLKTNKADLNLAVFHRKTDGYYENGTVVGIIANEDNGYRPQIAGFTSVQEASSYMDRDSVGLYVSNRSTSPTVKVSDGLTITYSNTSVTIPTGIDLSRVKSGMLIDTNHTPIPYTSIIDSVDTINNIITVKDGWYLWKIGGSTTTSIPSSNIGFKINQSTKLWGVNNNVFLYDTDTTRKAVCEEMGIFDYTTDGTSYVGGLDIANLYSAKRVAFAVKARGGYDTAFITADSQIALKSTSSTGSGKAVSTGLNDGTEKFYLTNLGKQNMLKLGISGISNGVTDISNYHGNYSIFSISKTVSENTIIFPATNLTGEIIVFYNTATIANSISVTVGNIGRSSNLIIPGRTSVVMVSDGTNWLVIARDSLCDSVVTYTSGSSIAVNNANVLVLASASTQTLQTLQNGIAGQEITIIATTANTTISSSSFNNGSPVSNTIVLKSGTNVTLAIGNTITLKYILGAWIETGRNF